MFHKANLQILLNKLRIPIRKIFDVNPCIKTEGSDVCVSIDIESLTKLFERAIKLDPNFDSYLDLKDDIYEGHFTRYIDGPDNIEKIITHISRAINFIRHDSFNSQLSNAEIFEMIKAGQKEIRFAIKCKSEEDAISLKDCFFEYRFFYSNDYMGYLRNKKIPFNIGTLYFLSKHGIDTIFSFLKFLKIESVDFVCLVKTIFKKNEMKCEINKLDYMMNISKRFEKLLDNAEFKKITSQDYLDTGNLVDKFGFDTAIRLLFYIFILFNEVEGEIAKLEFLIKNYEKNLGVLIKNYENGSLDLDVFARVLEFSGAQNADNALMYSIFRSDEQKKVNSNS